MVEELRGRTDLAEPCELRTLVQEDPQLEFVFADIATISAAGCRTCRGPLGVGHYAQFGFCSDFCRGEHPRNGR